MKKWRLVVVSFLVFWLLVKPATAKAVAWVIPVVIGTIITLLAPFMGEKLLDTVRSLAAWVLSLSAQLLSYVLSPQFNNLPLTREGIVTVGWTITREMANILFVIWMVIIAFSSILNIDDYGAKKRFALLITIALLVNFTQVITGVIVDMSQILMNFFIGQGLSPETPLAIAQAMHIDKLLVDNPEFGTILKEKSGLSQITFFGIPIGHAIYSYGTKIFSIIFLALAAHLFLLIALIFIIRIVALWIITILAPIAFVLGIMPFGSGWLKTWWSQLFSWSFIGVTMAFFLYLAARLSFIINDNSSAIFKNFNTPLPPGTAIPFQAMAFLGQFSPFLIFLTIFAFLKIAQIAAQQISATGASQIIGAAERYLGKIDNFFKRAIKISTITPAKKGLTSIAVGTGLAARGALMAKEIPQAILKRVSSNKYLMAIPGMKEAAVWSQKQLSASEERIRKLMNDYKKMSTETQVAFYASGDYEQKIAIANNLAVSGDLAKLNLTPEELRNLYQGAKNISKDFSAKIGIAAPSVVFTTDKERIEHISANRHLSHLIDKNDLLKPEVVAALGKTGVENIIKKQDAERIENVAEGIRNLERVYERTPRKLQEYADALKLKTETLKKINEAQKKIISNIEKWGAEPPPKEKEYKEPEKKK